MSSPTWPTVPASDALRDRALDRFGAVHLVHNNAGVGVGGPIWEVSEEDWRWILDVNLWGVVHGINTFVPLLMEQGEGHVVNTASIAGLVASPFLGPYNATKQAVVAISETLFKDLQLAGSPVGVSVLCPGFVQTRIDESERNRPSWAPAAEGEDAENMRGAIKALIASGIPPAVVADGVDRCGEDQHLLHPDPPRARRAWCGRASRTSTNAARPARARSAERYSFSVDGAGVRPQDELGSGLNGCTVTQHVPCGFPLVFSLHCDDGGTLLWTLTTWYCTGRRTCRCRTSTPARACPGSS